MKTTVTAKEFTKENAGKKFRLKKSSNPHLRDSEGVVGYIVGYANGQGKFPANSSVGPLSFMSEAPDLYFKESWEEAISAELTITIKVIAPPPDTSKIKSNVFVKDSDIELID